MKILIILFFLSLGLRAGEVRIGSKSFTEGNITSYIVAHTIKDIAPQLKVSVIENLGGTGIIASSLENNEIDLYVGYTGTLMETYNANSSNLKEVLLGHNLVMGAELGFNNSYGIAVEKDSPLNTIEDLKGHHKLGVTPESANRDDGFKGLTKRYSLNITPTVMEHALMHHSLFNKKLDAIEIYTTDAKIKRYNLKVLKDTRQFYKRYDAVIVYNKEFLEKNLDLVMKVNDELDSIINDQMMQKLNYFAEAKSLGYEETARKFTKSTAMIKDHNSSSVWSHFLEHLEYLIITVFICIVVGVPLGILTAKSVFSQRVILSVVSVTQTIPSLALLVFLIPLFGLGKITTIVALCLYGLLPIVKNTHTGIKKISSELTEYSILIGMKPLQRVLQIEIPLALTDIISGIKLTAIYTIGITVIAAFIGAGGLGTLIVTGLTLNDTDMILKGAIPSAGLALIVEVIFQKVLPLFFKERGIS